MKIQTKIVIWLVGVFLSCCFTISLYRLGAGVTAIPHANVQLLTTNTKNTNQIVAQVESLIISLGYIKQPDDGHVEWTYKKDDFTISYNQEDDEEYRKIAVWIHFYQWNNIYFDESGLAEYQSLINSLQSIGLEPTWINDPRYPGRKILTPEMFNAQNAPNPTFNRFKSALFGLALLLLYGVVILLPVFWIELMIINRLSLSIRAKRILFIIFNTLFLAPSPVPLPLLGPLPLIPAALMIPFVLASPEFLKLIGFSMIGMGIVAFFVSLFIKNSPLIDIKNSSSVDTNST